MKKGYFIFLFFFQYLPMQSQNLKSFNIGLGVNMPYQYYTEPIYESTTGFGWSWGSSPLISLAYEKRKEKFVYDVGLDFYKGHILLNWYNKELLSTGQSVQYTNKSGYVFNIYCLLGKNLFRNDQRFFLIPNIGLGLQANYFWSDFAGYGIPEPGPYRNVEYKSEIFNRVQLVPQAGLKFGVKIRQRFDFGMNWKVNYGFKKTERFTYIYKVLNSPEPNLERKTVTWITGTGLGVNFFVGIPLNKKSDKQNYSPSVLQ